MRHPRSQATDAQDLRARLADWADAMADLQRRYAAARKRLLELRQQRNDQAYAFWRLVDEVTSGTPPLYVGGGAVRRDIEARSMQWRPSLVVDGSSAMLVLQLNGL